MAQPLPHRPQTVVHVVQDPRAAVLQEVPQTAAPEHTAPPMDPYSFDGTRGMLLATLTPSPSGPLFWGLLSPLQGVGGGGGLMLVA